ncbi:cobalamin biosynthesis protein [uncultured Roseobacter sp.]|uniref:cobalamin biosynthesis protein n=1 Tax=uncultured Roseobacter sp. TaxID=114847 RepID=UPI002630D3A8|nr:cobalamin biosynthesis protein [uncultured Roseobacter sp.]
MIVAGFGFRSTATPESLRAALGACVATARPDAVATAADKARSDAFAGFAADLGLRIIPVDPDTLARQQTSTHSAASDAARGTGSVAEAAALAAAGSGARLLAPRVVSQDGMATCALAEGTDK